MPNTPRTNDDLLRTYKFSDVYGGTHNPLTEPDPDALIAGDFRSEAGITHRREFDIYGQNPVIAHLLRHISALHREMLDATYLAPSIAERFKNSITGVFINHAERTKPGQNGEPFYVATALDGRLRIVTTPLEALSAIRDQIETLHMLPNRDNGLYPNDEQYRSSYTPGLLYPEHGIDLEEKNPSEIPEPEKGWKVAYVDRFGNLLTYADPESAQRIHETLRSTEGSIRFLINNEEVAAHRAASLGEAEPGQVAVYANEFNVDFALKWEDGETSEDRQRDNAYTRFGRPAIGTSVEFAEATVSA